MFLVSFVINSILLGVGLAMDAFSVSIANGLNNPSMMGKAKAKIAGTFAGFQFLMPVLGWLFVSFLMESFIAFQKWIPWIAFMLLLYIGGKMIYEGFSKDSGEDNENAYVVNAYVGNAGEGNTDTVTADIKDIETKKTDDENIYDEKTDDEFKEKTNISNSELVIQGIATSIDALSAGFTMSNYTVGMAISGSLIIATVTFIICEIGLKIGIKVGKNFSKKASVFGGCILIFIGVKIIVTALFL